MLNLLIKPASSLCNMRCRYCFYHDLSAHRDVACRGIMSHSTAENLIKRALSADSEGVLFAFQGGEPTLAGLDFFEFFVKSVREQNKAGVKISYSLQTNGLTIDKDFAGFLRKNKFLVGLSLDGNAKVHNMLREDNGGKGTFKRVMKAAKILSAGRVDFNILTVITPELARDIEAVYTSLKKHNFRYLQFIPCLNPLECNEILPHTLTNDDYQSFLITLFDLWYKDFMEDNYFSIRYFDNLVFSYMGHGAEQCGMQGHCNVQYVVESDGAVYPCDFYCLDEYEIGNVNEDSLKEMRESATAKKFIRDSKAQGTSCIHCKCYKLCQSGCRRYKENNKYIYCEAFKAFYDHMYPRLEEIKRKIEKRNAQQRF